MHLKISWWRHQMETFSALLAICAAHSPVPAKSPHKGQWRGALMFSLICAWINGWVNNREAGDLRRHRTHYYVTVVIVCEMAAILSNGRWVITMGTEQNERKLSHIYNEPCLRSNWWTIIARGIIKLGNDMQCITNDVYMADFGRAYIIFVGLVICDIQSYSSGLLHWQRGNRMIAPVPVKQPWRILVYHTYITAQQNTAKPQMYT